MGTVGDALDNAVAESFFANPADRAPRPAPRWSGRAELARAMFDYIETFYNPVRRHSSCDMLSPADYDRTRRAGQVAAA